METVADEVSCYMSTDPPEVNHLLIQFCRRHAVCPRHAGFDPGSCSVAPSMSPCEVHIILFVYKKIGSKRMDVRG